MKNHSRPGLAALLLALSCLLSGCGEKVEAVTEYVLGEDSVVSLDASLTEGETAALSSITTPTEGAPEAYSYHYTEVAQPTELVSAYLSALTAEDVGFVVTDAENRTLAEEPALTEAEGSVILERASVTEGQIFQVTVDWREANCTVHVAHQEGEILPPEVEEEVVEELPEPTVLTEQLDYLYGKTPAQMGLEGDSMDAYHIYPVEGLVRVDGATCRRFNAYLLRPPEDTNTIQATYFLSTDLQYLYRLEEGTGLVVAID